MTWFKVDDQLHDHRKAAQASLQAMGLWVLAGSWCGDRRTAGFVPKRVIRRWAGDPFEAEACAEELVAVGLWTYADEDAPEVGYIFNDWATYNPTTTAEELSAARSEAGRKGGLASGQSRREAATKQVASSNEASVDEATKPSEAPEPVPVPVPVPVPSKTPRAPRSTPDLDTDPDFVAFWSAYPRKEGKGDAKKAWPKALNKASAADLTVAAKAYAERMRGTEPRFVKTPAAWLNGERWLDQAPAQRPASWVEDW